MTNRFLPAARPAMVLPALVLLLAQLQVLPGPASAAGFSARDAEAWARSRGAPADRLAGFEAAAEQFRAGLVRDPAGFARQRAPLEMAVLSGTLGTLSTDNGYYVSWLFRTAAAVAGGDSREPVATYYNPVVDVAAVTTWRRIDSQWRLTGMFLLDGAAFRAPGEPAWLQAEGNYAAALESRTAAVRAAVAGIRTGSQLPAAILAEDVSLRIESVRTRLATLAADPPAAEAVQRVRDALVEAEPERLKLAGAAPGALELETLAPDVRRSLVPVAAFDRAEGGLSVLIGSPLRPAMLVLADFTTGAAPAPLRINVLNLAGQPAAAVASTGAP